MSIYEMTIKGVSRLGYSGKQPPIYAGNDSNSKLHYTYSLNGIPNISGMPKPSQLDRNGVTPKKYLDNPPK